MLQSPLPFDASRPARSRSVVDRAEVRQLVSTILLIAMPVVAIMATPLPPPLALMVVAKPVLIVVVLFAWDVAVLVGTWRARRRMLRGLPPVRAGIDYGVGPDVWLVTVPADDPYRAQDRRELVARGSPEAAARVLAGNLVRRTCGIAVLGLVIAAFSFCCVTCPHHGAPGTMHTALNSIRSATILYMNAHEGRCPSVDDLKAEKGTEDDFTMPPQE